MRAKHYKGKVFGADLTAKERKAMELEIKRQMVEYERQRINDLDVFILYVLHTHFRFGKKRLRGFYEAFTSEYNKLIEHYQMPDDNTWLAERELKRIGVDVAEWNKEVTQ